jgi:hypothetical protein
VKSLNHEKPDILQYQCLRWFCLTLLGRICELSHVWVKKICHSNLSEFFSQTPLYVPIYNQTHSCPLGCSETVRKRFFFLFLQINNITNIGRSQQKKVESNTYFLKGLTNRLSFETIYLIFFRLVKQF